jgi:hypothetical protein
MLSVLDVVDLPKSSKTRRAKPHKRVRRARASAAISRHVVAGEAPDKKLLQRAKILLGYDDLLNRRAPFALAAALRGIGCKCFSKDSVRTYRRKVFESSPLYLTTALQQWVATDFALFKGRVPAEVLRAACEIKERLPGVKTAVHFLNVQRWEPLFSSERSNVLRERLRQQCHATDPVLELQFDTERYFIAAWNADEVRIAQ